MYYSWSQYSVCAQLCLTLCDPMDCSPPGSSAHGISQARILEQVAISFSKGSSQPRDQTQASYVACINRWILYHCTTQETLGNIIYLQGKKKHESRASLVVQTVKNPSAMQETWVHLGRSPGVGNGNPLQYSCLENYMDTGVQQATVHEVTKSKIRLSNLAWMHAYVHI